MESVAPPGGVMLSESTAGLVKGTVTLGESSASASKAPINRSAPGACWACPRASRLPGVLSRDLSAGAGRYPPSRVC